MYSGQSTRTPTYHTRYAFCLSQDCSLSLEWIEEMNEEQQYHVRRGLEAFIGEEAHPTIEMAAEEGARLAAHELGLDAPPVQPDTHEKSERISPFQSSLLVPIFLLYSAETWTKEVRKDNYIAYSPY